MTTKSICLFSLTSLLLLIVLLVSACGDDIQQGSQTVDPTQQTISTENPSTMATPEETSQCDEQSPKPGLVKGDEGATLISCPSGRMYLLLQTGSNYLLQQLDKKSDGKVCGNAKSYDVTTQHNGTIHIRSWICDKAVVVYLAKSVDQVASIEINKQGKDDIDIGNDILHFKDGDYVSQN